MVRWFESLTTYAALTYQISAPPLHLTSGIKSSTKKINPPTLPGFFPRKKKGSDMTYSMRFVYLW